MFFLTHGVVSMYFLVPRFCNLSYRIICTLRQRRSAGQCRRAVLRTRRRRPCGAARPRVLRVHGSRCADQGVPAWPTRRHVPLRRMGTTGCPPRRHSRSVVTTSSPKYHDQPVSVSVRSHISKTACPHQTFRYFCRRRAGR